jgi:predicted transcriptional regulator of viral defense system
MKPEIRERILEQFKQQSGYARTRDILGLGIHNIYLKELEKEGTITKIKRGLYCLQNLESQSTKAEALLTIPGGVLCLGTALSYYDLTTWEPPEIHVAIPHGRKVKQPEYPPIKLFYFTGVFYSTGIVEAKESGQLIRIYDIEKCICDLVRFRNRIGIDILKEALGEYLKRRDKDLNKLNTYSKTLKINSVLSQYLEVLI